MKYLFSILLMLAALNTRGQLKWASVERVYADLITAIGDGSKIAPPIELSRSESRVAYYSPSKQTIFVEERFLKICTTFGKDSTNALAFILGHELAHFYRNHGWVRANGIGYVDTELRKNWKEMSKEVDNHAKDEAEADIFSGFYSLVAGYDALPMAASTLKTIYKSYGINDTVPGYPTLQQRVEISQRAMGKATHLYTLFKIGLYCLATQKYDVAGRVYTHIYNQDYAGAEILNNLAIAEVLHGYEMYGEEQKFYYPIFISTETKLDPASRGGEGEEHIQKGIGYLKTASEKDPDNASYLINLASAYAMINDFVDAEYYLAKAEQLNTDVSESAQNLRGIIAMKKGNSKLAKKTWKGLKTDVFAMGNYEVAFKDAAYGMSTNEGEEGTFTMPLVDDVDLNDPRLKSKFDFKRVRLPSLRVSYVELETSILIEVYGGSDIDYRFQAFKSETFETQDYSWQEVLNSPTTTISNSANSNVLKIKNSGSDLPEFVKYVWY